MRRFSFLAILGLCAVIVLIDLLAYYWLQSITSLVGSIFFQRLVKIFFFVFMIGLVGAILFLKIRMDTISERRRHLLISSLYGLTVSSLIPKALFVMTISILFYSNYVFSQGESGVVITLVGLFSGFFPFFVIVYGIFKSVYHFKVYKIQLHCEALPQRFNGLRIVQFSDLHLGSFNYNYKILAKAFKKINDLQPDIIVFTGDLVNNYSWELEGWETVFKTLDARIGKYAVLGNHDYGDYSEWESSGEKQKNFEAIVAFFLEADFKLLRNEAIVLRESTDAIAFLGVENWGSPPFRQYGDLEKAFAQVDSKVFKILLSHDPSHWREEVLYKKDIALTLSGHTHGAQAGFTYKGKSWSPIKLKYEYYAGLYTRNRQHLYVNRGLGWLGFPGRVGMRPEITCIDLNKAGLTL